MFSLIKLTVTAHTFCVELIQVTFPFDAVELKQLFDQTA